MNRRQFLKSTTTALALASIGSIGSIAADSPAKKRDLKKGYMLGTFPGKDLPLLEKIQDPQVRWF